MTEFVGYYGTSRKEANQILQGRLPFAECEGWIGTGIYLYKDKGDPYKDGSVMSAIKEASAKGIPRNEIAVIKCNISADSSKVLDISYYGAEAFEAFRTYNGGVEYTARTKGFKAILDFVTECDKLYFFTLLDKGSYRIICADHVIFNHEIHKPGNQASGIVELFTNNKFIADGSITIVSEDFDISGYIKFARF